MSDHKMPGFESDQSDHLPEQRSANARRSRIGDMTLPADRDGDVRHQTEHEILLLFYFTATTSISKSSVVSLTFRLNSPSFAPNMSTLLNPRHFSIHVISLGT
jgi:hypothetical protein